MQLAPSAHVDTFTRATCPARPVAAVDFDLPELRYPPAQLRRRAVGRVVDRGRTAGPLGPAGRRRRPRDAALPRPAPPGRPGGGDLTAEVGLVPGNRVLLRGPNNPWLVACWFGVFKAGCVAVTTMPLLRAAELRTIHEIARIDHHLCDRRFVDDLAAADGPYTVVPAGPTASRRGRPASPRVPRRGPSATTSRCWRSRPAPPVGPRPRCTSIAMYWRWPTRSARTCSGRSMTTSSRVRPRSASHSGWAPW